MCLYPKLMFNKKYTATKKNKGKVPNYKDSRTLYVPIGCGKCIECLKQKANGWKIRLHEEFLNSSNQACFVTLTFNNDKINELSTKYEIQDPTQNNEIPIKAVRLFLENWRKSNKKSVKHWLVTELGHKNTNRIHLHGIIWGDPEEIKKHWKYGWIYIGQYVNAKTINYIIKYITKIDNDHKWFHPKILCSPGIGSNYINTPNRKYKSYNGEKTDQSYDFKNGKKGALPTYYRNKIYSEDEREQLWINRLNKEERWVRGEKISIKNGLEKYYKARDWHRNINRQMGYGGESQEEEYNQKLHEIKNFTTIAKQSHSHNSEASEITPNNKDLNNINEF